MRIKHHGPRSKSAFERSLDELADRMVNGILKPGGDWERFHRLQLEVRDAMQNPEKRETVRKALAKELTRTGKHRKT